MSDAVIQGSIVTTSDTLKGVISPTPVIQSVIFSGVQNSASDWNQITGKPTTFTPVTHASSHQSTGSDPLSPADIGAAYASHSHSISQITGLTDSLTGLSDRIDSHSQPMSRVTGLTDSLTGLSDRIDSHTQPMSRVTGLTDSLTALTDRVNSLTGFAIGDAPSGSSQYARVSGAWAPVTLPASSVSGLGSLATLNDAVADGKFYARKDGGWTSVTLGIPSFNTRNGPITLTSADVINALTYTPANSSQSGAAVAPSSLLPASIGSAASTGTSEFAARADHVHAAPNASLIQGLGSLATLNDAASDNNLYARKNGTWAVVTLSGGTSSSSQVNSDWAATSGVAQILNKPTLFSGSYTALTDKPTTVLAHKSSHASGGSDSLTPADIGAAAASHTHTKSQISDFPTLSAVATSGKYSDLLNLPIIPGAQVNANWTATSGVAQILNKPTLFSGSYTDLTGKPTIPTIPTTASSGQVLVWDGSNWTAGNVSVGGGIKIRAVGTISYSVGSSPITTAAVMARDTSTSSLPYKYKVLIPDTNKTIYNKLMALGDSDTFGKDFYLESAVPSTNGIFRLIAKDPGFSSDNKNTYIYYLNSPSLLSGLVEKKTQVTIYTPVTRVIRGVGVSAFSTYPDTRSYRVYFDKKTFVPTSGTAYDVVCGQPVTVANKTSDYFDITPIDIHGVSDLTTMQISFTVYEV